MDISKEFSEQDMRTKHISPAKRAALNVKIDGLLAQIKEKLK